MTKIEAGKTYKFSVEMGSNDFSYVQLKKLIGGRVVFLDYSDSDLYPFQGRSNLNLHPDFRRDVKFVIGKVHRILSSDTYDDIVLYREKIEFLYD
jgi:hypothetical protein